MLKHISVRKYVFANSILLILLISSLLLGLQYYSNKQLALRAVGGSFVQTSNNVFEFLEASASHTSKLLQIFSLNPDLDKKLDRKKLHPIFDDFVNLMKMEKRVKSMYLAYANDDFFEIINLRDDLLIAEKYSAPLGSKWVAITLLKQDSLNPSKKIQFLDENLEILSTKKIDLDFRPTSRIWYKKAMQKNSLIMTDVYKFSSTDGYGITHAKKIGDKGKVIGMDYSLSAFNTYLSEQNFDDKSYIILYQNDGKIIASSRDVNLKAWTQLYPHFKDYKEKDIHYSFYKGLEYFTYHSALRIHNNENINIAILLPKPSLLEPYMKQINRGVYAALAFIFLSIPFVLYSTSLIVKPMRSLMLENKKILKRNFSQVKDIKTNITELHQLSNSLVSMSGSIESYQKSQEKLLDSIVKLIADAIDAKSTYTGGHCERVPKIAEMLTHYVSDSKEGVFKDFSLTTADEWREFHIGAWLHDCGKVTTPEYVVDKSTKLETIYNRIHEIRTRFEVLFRDAQISYLESQLKGEDKELALQELHQTQSKLVEDFNFLASANEGGEFMSPDKQKRIQEIAKQTWLRNFNDRVGLSADEMHRYKETSPRELPVREQLLSDKQEHIIPRENFNYEAYRADGFKEEVPEYLYNYGEIYNLCISKGTLTPEERFKINEHVIMSIKMLEALPFPPELKKIPEYAGTHHETMIGTGYPRKLTKEQLSVPARIMAIADIFEALTASDRPYKKAKTLSESLKIMSFMVKDEHIDEDLFDLFLESGIYLKYAQKHLTSEQIDEVDVKSLLS